MEELLTYFVIQDVRSGEYFFRSRDYEGFDSLRNAMEYSTKEEALQEIQGPRMWELEDTFLDRAVEIKELFMLKK